MTPGLTAGKIRSISMGMSKNEVTQILGSPLGQELTQGGRYYWKYARPVPKARSYPLVRVFFEAEHVSAVEVELKTFWGVDEEAIYQVRTGFTLDGPALDALWGM